MEACVRAGLLTKSVWHNEIDNFFCKKAALSQNKNKESTQKFVLVGFESSETELTATNSSPSQGGQSIVHNTLNQKPVKCNVKYLTLTYKNFFWTKLLW